MRSELAVLVLLNAAIACVPDVDARDAPLDVPALLTVEPAACDFDALQVGLRAECLVRVTNVGDETAYLGGEITGPPFFMGVGGVVAAGSGRTIRIEARPVAAGVFDGVATIRPGNVAVPLHMEAVEATPTPHDVQVVLDDADPSLVLHVRRAHDDACTASTCATDACVVDWGATATNGEVTVADALDTSLRVSVTREAAGERGAVAAHVRIAVDGVDRAAFTEQLERSDAWQVADVILADAATISPVLRITPDGACP